MGMSFRVCVHEESINEWKEATSSIQQGVEIDDHILAAVRFGSESNLSMSGSKQGRPSS